MVCTRLDRFALSALTLAALCLALAAVAAQASSGGVTSPGHADTPTTSGRAAFGARVLRVGMKGSDVRVLNGIVKSKSFAAGVSLSDTFEGPTAGGVREFQRRRGLAVTGVVDQTTAQELTRSMRRAGATWYGPGLYGNTTACGQTLRTTTTGVAHKTLPCGTRVTLSYRGRYVVTRVIDRGPYHEGYDWDIANATRQALGFEGAGEVRYAVAR